MAAFDAMDDRRRQYNLIAMEGQARRFPRKGRAILSLVHTPRPSVDTGDVLNESHCGSALLIVKAVK